MSEQSEVSVEEEKYINEITWLDFNEFSHYWRSCVRVSNTILQYCQYDYVNDFVSNHFQQFIHFKWVNYIVKWKRVNCTYQLLEILKRIETNSDLEEEQKNEDIKYLNELNTLLEDVSNERMNILTWIPPVPELNLGGTTSTDKSNEQQNFHKLLHFQAIIYRKELSSESLLEAHENLLKNIFDNKEQFDKFIRNFMINQEGSGEVLQRWVELQQSLSSHFETKPMKSRTSNKFTALIQSLLNIYELHRVIKIQELYNDKLYTIRNNYHDNINKDDIILINKNRITLKKFNIEKVLFLLVLLDVRFELKNFIKAHELIIQRKLNNFQSDWRRMLYVPITLLQYEQYQVQRCHFKITEFAEREKEKMKTRDTFKQMWECELNYYVIYISINLEILKHTSVGELDQLIQDAEYLNNLLKRLPNIFYGNEANMSVPLPPIQQLNVINATRSPNVAEEQLNEIAVNLHHFASMSKNHFPDVNPTRNFLEWNRKMIANISKNLGSLNDLINEYIKSQKNAKYISILWNEFKAFINYQNSLNNFQAFGNIRVRSVGQNQFNELYQLISDKYRHGEIQFLPKLQIPLPILGNFRNDEISQMQIYSILFMNAPVDLEDFNVLDDFIQVTSQLLIYFKFATVKRIISNSYFDDYKQIFGEIIFYIKSIIEIDNKEEELTGYHNLLTQFNDNLISSRLSKSIEKTEIVQKSISNLVNNKNINEKHQNIIINLYSFWQLFIHQNDRNSPKESYFYEWNVEMFLWIHLHLNEIDAFLKKFVIRNDNDDIAEMWNCLRKCLLEIFHNPDEINWNSINHSGFFLSLLNDNLCLPKGMEYLFNYIYSSFTNSHFTTHLIDETKMLSILILLDAPCSLNQIEHFVYWQNSSQLNAINCNQFNYYRFFIILDASEISRFNSFDFLQFNYDIKQYYKYVYAHTKLNLNSSENIKHYLKEINEDDFEDNNNYFFLDDTNQLAINSFQLEIFNNIFLLQFRQIIYLEFYFQNTIVLELTQTKIYEKLFNLLEYIFYNFEEMDEFVNNYFHNLESMIIFKTNWILVKEQINRLSLEDFHNCWKLLFLKGAQDALQKYFEKNKLYNSKLFVEVKKNDAAKHVLLILLNVPLTEILKNHCQQPLSLDDLFSMMHRYKELKLHLDDKDKQIIISTQYNLTMDKFIAKLENVPNASENVNESSQLLVKSEFNRLEKNAKVAVIENLISMVQSQNTHGCLEFFFKISLSLLPLNDIIWDIILAINFFRSNEFNYFYLTIGILLITGIATVITERILKSEIQWKPTYYVEILNYDKLKYLLTFTQITFFLRSINETLLRLEIKKKKNNSYLEFINYGDPEFLKKETQTLKYVEMCFEAIPQTILQLYIILMKNDSSWLQLLSIINSICSAMVTVWGYISSRDPKNDPSISDNPRLLLRELCFYGLRTISTSLMLAIFSWPILIIWIGLRFLLDFAIRIYINFFNPIICTYFNLSNGVAMRNYKTNIFSLFSGIHSDLFDDKIYNIVTLVEFIVDYLVFVFHLHQYPNNMYFGAFIFSVYPILFLTWIIIIYLDKFVYTVNVSSQNTNSDDLFVRYKNRLLSLVFWKNK